MSGSDANTFKSNSGGPWFPVLLVLAAVFFNAALAFVNGSVMSLGMRHVIMCELVIVMAAHFYALMNFDKRMVPWYVFIVAVGAFAILRMVVTEELEVKYFRDLLLLQTFVVLGMTASLERSVQGMLLVTAVVVAGVLLEALSLKTYSSLFHVKDFYINTRGLVSSDFTTEASDLYVSANRPDARHIPFFGLHRLSSIFLEPVSLGNFAVIMVAFSAAFWGALKARAQFFMVAACILVLAASDGRLALAAVALMLTAVFLRPLVPKYSSVFVLPLVLVIAVFMVSVGDWYSGVDTLKGRLAYTVQLLFDMSAMDYFGLSDRLVEKAVDSGIVYLIVTQSVVMVTMLWVLICFEMAEDDPAKQNYKNSVCIYIALTMMVSFSLVSIKTAAPLWFLYGALVVSRATVARPGSIEVNATANSGTVSGRS